MTNALTVNKQTGEITESMPQILALQDVKDQINLIQQVMRFAMKEKEHYGTVPGCGTKMVLFKSGAEKLCLTFRMAPEFKIETINLENNHREYRVTCNMTNIKTKEFLGSGIGSASTMESKYRYREDSRKCPKCNQSAITKGKAEYGGGYYCNPKKEGCGAKFKDKDPQIESQKSGKSENSDIADVYNTVLKIAKKRALVDAALTATAASDIFTQDLEENYSSPTQPQTNKFEIKKKEVANGLSESTTGRDKHDSNTEIDSSVEEGAGSVFGSGRRTEEIEFEAPKEEKEIEKVQKVMNGKITDAQRKRVFAIMRSAGLGEDQVKAYIIQHFSKNSTKDLHWKEMNQLVEWMQNQESPLVGE